MATNKNKSIKKSIDEVIKTEPSTCFYISPIGKDGSEVREKMDGICKAVIIPVLDSFDYKLIRPQEMFTNDITTNIVELLLKSDLVIANLTGLNPNVMYELAIRDGLKKPVVIIAEDGTDLPFDIQDMNCLFYKDNAFGVSELKDKLKETMEQIHDESYEVRNIITRAIGSVLLENLISDAPEGIKGILLELNNKISSLEWFVSSAISRLYIDKINKDLSKKKSGIIKLTHFE